MIETKQVPVPNGTGYGYPPELAREGQEWWEPDIEDLKKQMRFVFGNKEKAKEIGLKGLEHARKNLSAEACAKKFIKVIDDIINHFMETQKPRQYSQFGEDNFILSYLVDNKIVITPNFVDIGAYDVEQFSNSKLFKDTYNWNLFLVDANEKAIEGKGDYEYIVSQKGLFGYLELDQEKWGLANVKTAKKKTAKFNRPCQTLSEYLASKNLTEKDSIGVLSVDIEGTELEVLKELFDNSVTRPFVICAEGNTKKAKDDLKKLLEKEYDLIGEIEVNLIFARKDIKNYV